MDDVKIERLKRLNEDVLEDLIEVYMRGYEGLEEYGGEGRDYARDYIKWCWKKAPDGFFVAKVGDRIVGFIVCDRDWYSRYEGKIVGAIHEFVVDKGWQGKGIGKKLLTKCLEFLGKYNDTIELWVGEKNFGAMRLYEKFGFKKVGKSGIWIRMVRRQSL
ncbi:GNAT family N-acetyltransferase [Pyrococcus abyssi]|uniref:N-acetyltransferase n=1 Tax=Pyrococcus abyssi (strain GE5 / Orsay) TaxID=272844 RepID=Q9UY00_PYRAB|nr:GNAT family N-acetyltransferase [Pyrococcus abyssi]CAB50612.1 N-acetyltransferase [Pyrococcus abyssi GE5]CCE71178.1 TPA: ribosomal protein s18 alanine acetyltransf erase related protein [Pyrococcus abyssi GE5]